MHNIVARLDSHFQTQFRDARKQYRLRHHDEACTGDVIPHTVAGNRGLGNFVILRSR